MGNSLSIQHVNVKIFAEAGGAVDLAAALPVFHRWIQEEACEELLIDVADYRHVPAGPGVVLVGHQANYSLDNRGNLLGLLYNRKAALEGGPAENITQALRAALAACRRLEPDAAFQGKLQFDAGRFEITVNDRLLAPNTDETFQSLRPAIRQAVEAVYGPERFAIERAGEPRERLRIDFRAGRPIKVAAVLCAATV
jgi:hypothetical protein